MQRAHLCMKCSLGISDFLEEISSLSHSVVFLSFFALITEEGFLISPGYSLELCIRIGISFLFSFAFFSDRMWSTGERNGKPLQFLPWKLHEQYEKAKWLSEQALQIPVKRRDVNGKGEKERYTHLNAEFQRRARRDKKAFLSDHCKEIEQRKTIDWKRLEISLRKLEIRREHFIQR